MVIIGTIIIIIGSGGGSGGSIMERAGPTFGYLILRLLRLVRLELLLGRLYRRDRIHNNIYHAFAKVRFLAVKGSSRRLLL
jgi:hypothetical protein